jgi:hypothetical protein
MSWIVLQSCADAVITPLQKNEKVFLITPVNRLVSANHNQYFSWAVVTGTNNYRLQIVTPDFRNSPESVVDTIIPAAAINITLDRGAYKWCVNSFKPDGTILTSDTNTLTIH